MTKILLTPEKINHLKFIDTQNLLPGRYNFPDFLIIGPQRTGTTWLQQNLIKHPEIDMPAQKELFFFSHLKVKSCNKNFTSCRLEWYSKMFATWSGSNILHHLKERGKDLLQKKKCFEVFYKFRNYLSGTLIKGEATASYAAMEEDLIEELILLQPEIKIILFVRHPYERAWSHAKKDLVRDSGRSYEDINPREFEDFFSSDYQLRCGRYTALIDKWLRYIPEKNFFIGFFDDVTNNPRKLLKNIYTFLCVADSDKYIEEQLSAKVINQTEKMKIPPNYRLLLHKLFSDEVRRMNNRFQLNWDID
ncbi:MAG: sulfotransferase [Thermodesulfobacteriota bacterium]